MPPKVIVAKKKNQSSNDEETLKRLSMAAQANNSKLPLNLGWILKSDLINSFSKFSCLLKADSLSVSSKKESSNLINELMQRLTILTSDLNLKKEANENLKLINDNLLKDSIKSNNGLFFELDSSFRGEIFNLLSRNFHCLLLSEFCEPERENLIKENNSMICILLNLVSKKLEIADEDDVIYNPPKKKSKSDDRFDELLEKVTKLEKKVKEVDNLKKQIKEIDIRSDKTTFIFEVKNVEEFLSFSQSIRSKTFYCSSLPWCLILYSGVDNFGTKFICSCLKLVDFKSSYDWTLKVNAELSLLSQSTLNNSKKSNLMYFSLKNGENFKKSYFVSHNELAKFIKDDKFKVEVNMKSDLVFDFKDHE